MDFGLYSIILAKINSMKIHYIFLLSFFIISSQFSLAQQMPIDFSESGEVFSVWGGSSFSTRQSPSDSSNTVGQFYHAPTTGEQGFYIDLTRPIDLGFQNTISLYFYAFDPNIHTVGLKLERGGVNNPIIQRDVNTTSSQNNWIQLTFNFSGNTGSRLGKSYATGCDHAGSAGTFACEPDACWRKIRREDAGIG